MEACHQKSRRNGGREGGGNACDSLSSSRARIQKKNKNKEKKEKDNNNNKKT